MPGCPIRRYSTTAPPRQLWLASPRRWPRRSGRRGVRVNTVSPGPVATDLWLGSDGVAATVSRATGARPSDVEDQAAAQSVTGRFSQPAEIASLILYLVSDQAANITGSDFTIDGGLVPTL